MENILEKKSGQSYNSKKRGNSSMDKPKKELSIIGKIVVAFIVILVLLTIACRIIVSRNVVKRNEIIVKTNYGEYKYKIYDMQLCGWTGEKD